MNDAAMKNSGRLAQVAFDYGQSRIAAEVAACDVDFHFGPIARADRNGFGQLPVGESFVRRPHAQCTVGTLCVVPCRERIETTLNNPPFAGGAGYGSCRSPNGFSYDVELHAYK